MINACSRTFKGHSGLTPNNVDRQALTVDPPVASRKGEEIVNLSSATADENKIIGAYSGNPGHEDNSVSVDVLGEFEIRMLEAVDAADIGLGVVSSGTAGLGKALAGGFGRIIGGRVVDPTGTPKYYARIIV